MEANKSIGGIITKKGIYIPLKLLKSEDIKNLYSQTLIKPLIDKRFNNFKNPISLKQIIKTDNGNILVIPRFFKLKNYKIKCIKNLLDNNKTIEINFLKSLNENQILVINKTWDKIINDLNMLYCLPCGFGKTVIAIYIICKLKLRTFILVHKEELLNQWIERLLFFTDIKKEEIGIIRGNKDIENKHKIIIGMAQTLMTDTFDNSRIPNDIGLLCCDECHHLGAEKFNKSIQRIPTKYYISLSATPYRKDGTEDVYKSFLGYNVYTQEREFNDDVIVYKYNYEFSKEFKEENEKILNNPRGLAKTISLIALEDKRNEILINLIKHLIKEQKKILILSDRIEQLLILYDEIIKINDIDKYKDLKINRLFGRYREDINCDVLFATYAMAAEGLDVPQLNTLILATPKTDIIQCCGRIMRKSTGETREIYDFVDDIIEGFYYVRKKHYNTIATMIKNLN